MKILKMFNKNLLITALCVTPLVACAGTGKDATTPDSGDKVESISDLRFAVAVDKDGSATPVVTTKSGQQLKGKLIPRGKSVHASSIEEMETISVVRAKGSHYIVVSIGGHNYVFDLPH